MMVKIKQCSAELQEVTRKYKECRIINDNEKQKNPQEEHLNKELTC